MTEPNLNDKKKYLQTLALKPNKVQVHTWIGKEESKLKNYLHILENAQHHDPNFWYNSIHTFREQSHIFAKSENRTLLAAVIFCLRKYIQKHLKTENFTCRSF